jgi:RIO kinase 1
MEFIGDDTGAAPQLARARLGRDELEDAWSQLVTNLHRFVSAGLVHADLSAYNLLWRDGRIVVIDLPQAVEISRHPTALDLLHRDMENVGAFFGRKGITCNIETVFAALAAEAFRPG